MRGPNAWSDTHQKLIVAKLGNISYENIKLPELGSRLTNIFPQLRRVIQEIEKTSASLPIQIGLARLLAITGLEIQALTLPGLYYYNAHLLGENSFYAVFEYHDEEHGLEAAKVAGKILSSLINNETYNQLAAELKKLGTISAYHSLGPSTGEIVNEARRRDIPVKEIAEGHYIMLGHGKHQKRIQATITGDTGFIAVNTAGDKNITKQLLTEAMIPVPKGFLITKEEELKNAIEKIGFPLVTKPLNGHQGKCVTTNITNFEGLRDGFHHAQSYSHNVIIEKHLAGNDYRFLVINYKVVAVAHRQPAMVKGNGVSTIGELIELVNKDPRRGKGHNCVLTQIEVDEKTEKILASCNRTIDSVLPEGEVQVLKDTANLSTGGTATDVTDDVHPYNTRLAERAARIIGLDICGIDIMAPDVTRPFKENGGAIIEVNAAPGLRMHFAPSAGLQRPVGKAIVDMLFPKGSPGRIPIIAVTGTNGKTTTSRLMAHIVQQQGFLTGLTATEGIYINGKQVFEGDCSGPKSANVILQDPSVEFAVLECARGGIIRSGLAFDQCDIGIVTNVAADHLGLNDIYTIEDMARVKEVVPKSVKKNGYAILNASNDLVRDMSKRLDCGVAFFSLREEDIKDHCAKGGLAAFRNEDGYIVIKDGKKEITIDHVNNIPLTLQGRAEFNIENVLPVVLASYILKFDLHHVKKSLNGFAATSETTPGRLNIIDINKRHVIIDYAHNPHSLKAFGRFLESINDPKTGIITGVGDRRDEDIVQLGSIAAEIYDNIIIRIDIDTRGRAPEKIASLLTQGIKAVKPGIQCPVIPDIKEALYYALEQSEPGTYIVLNAEKVDKTLRMVNDVKQEFENVHN